MKSTMPCSRVLIIVDDLDNHAKWENEQMAPKQLPEQDDSMRRASSDMMNKAIGVSDLGA